MCIHYRQGLEVYITALALVLCCSPALAALGFDGPRLLNTDDIDDFDSNRSPTLATDGLGNWVAVWQLRYRVRGVPDPELFVSRSTDVGATWSTEALLNPDGDDDAGVDSKVQIGADATGTFVIVWESDKDLGGTGSDSDIHFCRSIDSGATWSSPAALNTNAAADTGFDHAPQIATDGSGNWTAVWHSYEDLNGAGTDADIFISYSSDGGATWSAPDLLNRNGTTDKKNDLNPSIATDGAGRWICVWVSNENVGGSGSDQDILCSSLTRGGTAKEIWTLPAVVNSNATSDTANDRTLQIATDRDGTWIAVWVSNDDALGFGGDADVFHARLTGGDSQWSDMAPLNSTAAVDSGDDLNPHIAADSAGHWVAVWSSNEPYLGSNSDPDIFCARSTDAGATWGNAGLLNSNSISGGRPDQEPKIATDDLGNWLTVWDSEEIGVSPSIYDSPDIHVSTSNDLDLTDNFFVIVVPDGGEEWKAGKKRTIEWISANSGVPAVKLDLYRNSAFVRTIVESTPDDGEYNWTIPNDLTSGNGYRLRVLSTIDSNVFDESDAPFKIKHAK
ncbi:MAG: exo-alpha-sialidase [Candidatus Hydrogenedentes bacterium]|nr:exo-alpha-sialidase [Candidatus Hydrogenedentota bacterium]